MEEDRGWRGKAGKGVIGLLSCCECSAISMCKLALIFSLQNMCLAKSNKY